MGTPRKPRGFACLTPEQRRAIARKGGTNAHAQGVAHRWTTEEARSAGQKGGNRRWKSKTAGVLTPDAASSCVPTEKPPASS